MPYKNKEEGKEHARQWKVKNHEKVLKSKKIQYSTTLRVIKAHTAQCIWQGEQ